MVSRLIELSVLLIPKSVREPTRAVKRAWRSTMDRMNVTSECSFKRETM